MKNFLRATANQNNYKSQTWIEFVNMTSSMLSTLYGLAYLTMISIWGNCYYYLYFAGEETEAQKGYELLLVLLLNLCRWMTD